MLTAEAHVQQRSSGTANASWGWKLITTARCCSLRTLPVGAAVLRDCGAERHRKAAEGGRVSPADADAAAAHKRCCRRGWGYEERAACGDTRIIGALGVVVLLLRMGSRGGVVIKRQKTPTPTARARGGGSRRKVRRSGSGHKGAGEVTGAGDALIVSNNNASATKCMHAYAHAIANTVIISTKEGRATHGRHVISCVPRTGARRGAAADAAAAAVSPALSPTSAIAATAAAGGGGHLHLSGET